MSSNDNSAVQIPRTDHNSSYAATIAADVYERH